MGKATTIANGSVIVLLIARVGVASADVSTYCAGVKNKIDRGACNLLGAPILEVPYQVHSTAKKKNLFAGVTMGLGKGVFLMPLRSLSGLYDLLTFPLPFPGNFDSLIKPGYIPWQERTSTE